MTTTTALPAEKSCLGGGVGLFEGGGHLAGGHGDAVLAQDLFGLILVNLHVRSVADAVQQAMVANARETSGNVRTAIIGEARRKLDAVSRVMR